MLSIKHLESSLIPIRYLIQCFVQAIYSMAFFRLGVRGKYILDQSPQGDAVIEFDGKSIYYEWHTYTLHVSSLQTYTMHV